MGDHSALEWVLQSENSSTASYGAAKDQDIKGGIGSVNSVTKYHIDLCKYAAFFNIDGPCVLLLSTPSRHFNS